MRLFQAKNGDTYEVRGLTRGEIKELRSHGYNLAALTVEQADDAMDLVFEMVFGEADILAIDQMPNAEALRLWRAVLAETYGSGDEEKNLSTSGSGTQTDSGLTIAGSAGSRN